MASVRVVSVVSTEAKRTALQVSRRRWPARAFFACPHSFVFERAGSIDLNAGCQRSAGRLAGVSDAAGSGGDAVALTLVTMTTGQRYEVDGSAESVEAAIVGASRGSIMQLAWLTEAASGRSIAINPLHVVALEPAPSPTATG